VIKAIETKYGTMLSMGIKVDEFITFLESNTSDKGWVNITIKERRDPSDVSTHYAELFVPQKRDGQPRGGRPKEEDDGQEQDARRRFERSRTDRDREHDRWPKHRSEGRPSRDSDDDDNIPY
jgi:hypothetical protein